jgi:hypothetical protein
MNRGIEFPKSRLFRHYFGKQPITSYWIDWWLRPNAAYRIYLISRNRSWSGPRLSALDELFSIRQLVVVCQFGIITNLSTATFRPAVRCSALGKSITVIASNFLMVPGFGKGKISVSSMGDVLPGV